MIKIPDDPKDILSLATELIGQCRNSVGTRAAYYRTLNQIAETGKNDGTPALINSLDNHLDRTAGYLYSSTELRFAIEYDNTYDKNVQERSTAVARHLTRTFRRIGADMLIARGVKDALKYGSYFLKTYPTRVPDGAPPRYESRLVGPWQFGVYNENVNEIDKQIAMCETSLMTLPDVWKRIWFLPDAEKLYRRIVANANKGMSNEQPTSFFHGILSTNQISSGVESNARSIPGGIMQINSDPTYYIMGAEVAAPLVKFHELWVQTPEDYVTIQVVEPDILVSPLYQKANGLTGDIRSGLHPYTLLQPNEKTDYLWGQTELQDLIMPQSMLAGILFDLQRLCGLQVDKILAFIGFDGMKQEAYDQFRGGGWLGMQAGSDVKDLTPKFPAEIMAVYKLVREEMDRIGGFPNILQGQGEAGVRAGVHAETLLRTGSPRLRDRSLLTERQVAKAADLLLSLMQAKDGRNFWSKGNTIEEIKESEFLLKDLPSDRQVVVDSHSSSPIFASDHEQLVGFGVKSGFINGENAIRLLPYPEKDRLITAYKDDQAAKAKQMQEMLARNPQLAETVEKKMISGR